MAVTTFKVEVKSKEMIKPSSETPDHLKILHLSSADLSAPPIHMPYMFYYQSPNSKTTTKLLKNSLSQTLVHFYPLAGRVQGNLLIDCNDQGVEFYEAHVLASLAEVIADPDPAELIRLLPCEPINDSSIVTAVQVNHFSCGGMAISACICHKVADGATAVAFITAWARSTRGLSNNAITFGTTSFFPSVNLDGTNDHENSICKGKIVTRRLIFDREKLDELKKKCDDGRLESPPTKAGVVTAFIWKMFIRIARAKPTPPKVFNVWQVVSLKTIKGSPIPEHHQGNLVWNAFTHTTTEPEIEYSKAVGMLRTALKKVDLSYLPKIKTGAQKDFESFSREEGNFCGITSVIRMPMYEVDFGWGKPVWVSITTVPFQNTAVLMPTKCGQGIEAWVQLLEHDTAMLDEDHECRSVISRRIRPKL